MVQLPTLSRRTTAPRRWPETGMRMPNPLDIRCRSRVNIATDRRPIIAPTRTPWA